jgi:hypothetical protein
LLWQGEPSVSVAGEAGRPEAPRAAGEAEGAGEDVPTEPQGPSGPVVVAPVPPPFAEVWTRYEMALTELLTVLEPTPDVLATIPDVAAAQRATESLIMHLKHHQIRLDAAPLPLRERVWVMMIPGRDYDVPALVQLVHADETAVRKVIDKFVAQRRLTRVGAVVRRHG